MYINAHSHNTKIMMVFFSFFSPFIWVFLLCGLCLTNCLWYCSHYSFFCEAQIILDLQSCPRYGPHKADAWFIPTLPYWEYDQMLGWVLIQSFIRPQEDSKSSSNNLYFALLSSTHNIDRQSSLQWLFQAVSWIYSVYFVKLSSTMNKILHGCSLSP